MTEPTKPRLRLSIADLPKDILAAIGDITVNWSHVLVLVDVAIWGMLSLNPKRGTALTAPFKYTGKMDMFRSVGSHFFKERPELEKFKLLARKIDAIYSERNQVEHAIWQHYFGEDGPSIRVRILKDLSIEAKPFTAKDIDAISQRIIALVMELNEFMEKHIPPPPRA
jgi:hypothetical protein